MESLWVAKTGLDAQQTRMTVISNNLANVNTTGFKRGRAVFEDLLYQNRGQAGALTSQITRNPTGYNVGTGVRVVATEKTFTQGTSVNTGNSLDVMIDGRGFFQVLLPDGLQAYTRDGSFRVDDQGRLVTSAGYEVQPAITIPMGFSPNGLPRSVQLAAALYRDDLVLRAARAIEMAQPFPVPDLG